MVYTSAKGIYGPVLGEYGAPTYKPVPEDLPKNPKRIYDSAKLMAEQVGLYYQAHMGVDVVVLRFATTYGPGKTARHGKMGVTSQIVENPFNGLAFRLAQGGDEKDDFIYNKDSAHGIYLACTAERTHKKGRKMGLPRAVCNRCEKYPVRFNVWAPVPVAWRPLLVETEPRTYPGSDPPDHPASHSLRGITLA